VTDVAPAKSARKRANTRQRIRVPGDELCRAERAETFCMPSLS
jgi:hypothetical protein